MLEPLERVHFTFQYVSINTSLDEVFGYQEASLHSNMFLLILIPEKATS